MPSATIIVQRIEPPAPGKQKWKLVDENGDFYYLDANLANQYQEGGQYDVNFTTSEFRGFTIRNIGGGGGYGNRGGGGYQQRRAPAPQQATARPVQRTQGGGGYHDSRDESIFVNMTIKEAIRSGKLEDPFDEVALVELGRTARRAHKQIWAPLQDARQQSEEELNDSIPF